MRIAYYMPFKPMGHANPSGDLVIGSEIFRFLNAHGHEARLISRLRSRWIYWKPRQIAALPFHLATACRAARRMKADMWLTYHTYYKAPDLLGPLCSRRLKIPYVIFQGIYATKYRRRPATLPGFWLNRIALLAAKLVLSNKRRDYRNLKRIVRPERLVYVAPGIRTELFYPCEASRTALRQSWRAADRPVVITAAMFRPGVKTQGVRRVIEACGQLRRQGFDFLLVIAGDGETRSLLERSARKDLPERHLFLGKIQRDQLYRYYSAADLFAFPGIRESLGMVYLEAQACGLPVVAQGAWGAAEAVVADRTGILVDNDTTESFTTAMARLLENSKLRTAMGRAARAHVLTHHDVNRNYAGMIRALARIK